MTLSQGVLAYSQCNFDVNYVYLGAADGGVDDIYITLIKPTGGNASIYKNNNNTLSGKQIDRIYSAALTAFTAGKKLVVRYPEDNLDCSTLSGSRSDFIGVTLRN